MPTPSVPPSFGTATPLVNPPGYGQQDLEHAKFTVTNGVASVNVTDISGGSTTDPANRAIDLSKNFNFFDA